MTQIQKLMLVFIIAFCLAYACALVLRAGAAEAPPPPDQLVSCRSDLAVTGQYAAQMSLSRTAAEQDLARARALIADLQTQIEALKKPAEKPAEPKK